jgi:predicted glycosyltransferase
MGDMACILFDIGHPADVHLLRNPVKILRGRGCRALVLAREKDVTTELLDAYGIEYRRGTKQRGAAGGLPRELVRWAAAARGVIKKEGVSLVVSTGSSASALAAALSNVPSIVFADTETSTAQRMIYGPLTKKIYVSKCFMRDLGRKAERYDGFHELAYLRPEYFTPDPGVTAELGLAPGEKYAILRLVSWSASHDVFRKRPDDNAKRRIIETLRRRFRIFISAEGALPDDLESLRIKLPASRLHDAMAFASLVAGDGASTASEAAVMGTPSVYISPFAGSLGYIKFLRDRGMLFTETDYKKGVELLERLAESNLDDLDMKRKRAKLLEDTIDVSSFIADKCIENCRV